MQVFDRHLVVRIRYQHLSIGGYSHSRVEQVTRVMALLVLVGLIDTNRVNLDEFLIMLYTVKVSHPFEFTYGTIPAQSNRLCLQPYLVPIRLQR
jgi:hypothetical protein